MKDFEKYWQDQSRLLYWNVVPKKIFKKNQDCRNIWFEDGKLNLFENCVTRHLIKKKNKVAIIFIGQNKKILKFSYLDLYNKVNEFCEFLKNHKIHANKAIIHSSASPVSAISMLALAKLGIHFSVIFEDLQIEAINSRIKLLKPDLVITRSDKNGVLNISKSLKKNGIKNYKIISSFNFNKSLKNNKFLYFNFEKKNKKKNNHKTKFFKSSRPLFTLFTSGSTGEPKGITHGTGGYLLYSIYSSKKQFGMNSNSIVLTASDAGWINGHSYALFAPLGLGATTILLEKPTIITDYGFLEKILSSLSITILYLPVTLIRILKSLIPLNKKIKKNSLKAIGSMGEPLAASVASWYSRYFFNKLKPVVNTYFQTETGGIICSPKFNDKQNKYGTVGKPLNKFIKLNISKFKKKASLKILSSWPGCMINIINGKRYWNKYWDNKNFQLFDLSTLDRNDNIIINGRTDDVINIRGHRIGSEELESIILKIEEVVEAAAVSIDDFLEGQGFIFFLKIKKQKSFDLLKEKINKQVVSFFGSYALPKNIIFINELPKTKSGKILRRVLRSVYDNPKVDIINNISTINNKRVIIDLKKEIINQKIKLSS